MDKYLIHFYSKKMDEQLSTLVAMPRLDHGYNNDCNNDKKDDNCNAHPFPGVLLKRLGLLEGSIPLTHMIYCT